MTKTDRNSSKNVQAKKRCPICGADLDRTLLHIHIERSHDPDNIPFMADGGPREIIVAPTIADELSTRVHRTAISLDDDDPPTAGDPVRIRAIDQTPIAKAVVEQRIHATVDAVRQRQISRHFGTDQVPTLSDPADLLERIPEDDIAIDDPQIADLYQSRLQFYLLTDIRPIASDGGDDILDEDERQAIEDDDYLEVEDVIAYRRERDPDAGGSI